MTDQKIELQYCRLGRCLKLTGSRLMVTSGHMPAASQSLEELRCRNFDVRHLRTFNEVQKPTRSRSCAII
ncbi:MAG TPA: hypothetical protein VIE65_21885, partial [Methylobacter sp.]